MTMAKEDRGGFNTAPKGWTEITEAEFAKSNFFQYTFVEHEFRQLLRDFDGNEFGEMIAVRMFYLPNEVGYALSNSDYRTIGRIRYFRFGCEHVYRELGMEESERIGVKHYGMFCHVYECGKCGHVNVQDSSG